MNTAKHVPFSIAPIVSISRTTVWLFIRWLGYYWCDFHSQIGDQIVEKSVNGKNKRRLW